MKVRKDTHRDNVNTKINLEKSVMQASTVLYSDKFYIIILIFETAHNFWICVECIYRTERFKWYYGSTKTYYYAIFALYFMLSPIYRTKKQQRVSSDGTESTVDSNVMTQYTMPTPSGHRSPSLVEGLIGSTLVNDTYIGNIFKGERT